MNIKNAASAVIVLIVLAAAGYFFATKVNIDGIGTQNNKNHHRGEASAGYEIYPSEVSEKIKNNEDIILLDVRTPEEYEEIHLQNAILLPVQELSQQSLEEIGLGEEAKDKEIIIYCRSGARSKTAYNIMRSLGYSNIKSVSGGMIHWEEDGYQFTESGPYKGVSASSMNAQSGKEAKSGPRISLDRTFYDFGSIPQYGGVVDAVFTIKNNGTETLIIGDITTSCSCTSAKVDSKEVSPGGETTLTVYFDPNFHEEPVDVFKRTVFIPTNDKTNPEAEVSIQVDIKEGE